MPVARYLLRRAAHAAFVAAAVVIMSFVLLKAMPGDIVDVLAGEASAADIGYLNDLRSKFGLDRPFHEQLANFVWRMARFDLGYSFRHNTPVFDLIIDRMPATLTLMLAAMALAITTGIVLGVLAARNAGRLLDSVISALALLFYATPVFWIGLMMITLFTIQLNWLPSSGMRSIASDATGLGLVADVARHMIMPTLTLALFYLAVYLRMMRSSMLEVLQLDYVRTAWAKGLSPGRVARVHALPNAVLPVVTLAGVQIGHLLGGAILVETVFAWPGIGRLAFEAVFQRDINLLLGILFLSALLVAVMNLLVDLLYGWLDPRISLA
jgi:peptide/nickel transport system permease protein